MRMPAIRYRQGARTMYVTAGSPQAVIKFLEAPQLYDPRQPQEPGNRILDKGHLRGIVTYLEDEPNFVIGATTLYVRPGIVRFHVVGDAVGDEPVQMGYMSLPIGTRFTIGDGQHRLRAYEQILQTHTDASDPVLDNIRRSGTPAIIVEEQDATKTAQDFVDLQRNVKPLSSSLGASLDRRWGINRLAMELAKSTALLNDGFPGNRIEYLSQSLSKLSPKMYSFASWRYAIGTLLVGFSRGGGRRKLDQAAETVLARESFDVWHRRLRDLFDDAATRQPGWRDVAKGDLTVPQFREQYALGSSAGLTVYAAALHDALGRPGTASAVCAKLATIDWLKGSDENRTAFFEGTIVQAGKVVSASSMIDAAYRRVTQAITRTGAAA